VGPRGDLRHDTTEHAMNILRQDDERALFDLVTRSRYDSGGGFVAGRFNAQD
jgi:hypothetical protein